MVCLVNRAQHVKMIGDIGENLIKEILEAEGNHVELSENKFDNVKDMICGKQSVEVKTLVCIRKFNAFCLGSSQWKKCDEVDRLFFVMIPDVDFSSVFVYEAMKPRKHETMFYNNDQCRMYGLTDLNIYGIIENENIAKQLRDLSPSKYLKR